VAPAGARTRNGLSSAAGLAVFALVVWAIAGAVRVFVAVGHYEHRIEVAVHGNRDPVLPALFFYDLLAAVMPRGTVTTVADRSWILASSVAVVAFVVWLRRARRGVDVPGGGPVWASGWAVGRWLVPVARLVVPYLVVRDVRRATGLAAGQVREGRWWASVLVTVSLAGLALIYDVVTSDGGVAEKSALDMRVVAYLLWTAEAVAIVVTGLLSTRLVRQITRAQRPTAGAAATAPA